MSTAICICSSLISGILPSGGLLSIKCFSRSSLNSFGTGGSGFGSISDKNIAKFTESAVTSFCDAMSSSEVLNKPDCSRKILDAGCERIHDKLIIFKIHKLGANNIESQIRQPTHSLQIRRLICLLVVGGW
jgi:hypothetical protein